MKPWYVTRPYFGFSSNVLPLDGLFGEFASVENGFKEGTLCFSVLFVGFGTLYHQYEYSHSVPVLGTKGVLVRNIGLTAIRNIMGAIVMTLPPYYTLCETRGLLKVHW
jgi:hypothetical protein